MSPHGLKVGNKTYSTLSEFIERNRDKFVEPAQYCWMGAIEDAEKQKQQQKETNTIYKSPEVAVQDSTCPLCVICMDKPQETIFLECGHMCCCRECAERIMPECPVCREPILRIVNVFQA